MSQDLIGVLERLVVGSVAITARAIAAAEAELTFMQWRVLLVVGLVSTSKGEPDKRVVCVRLTETGQDLRARVLALRGRDIADVLEVVSMTPEESEALARLAQAFEPFA
jgi:hypothetical protein